MRGCGRHNEEGGREGGQGGGNGTLRYFVDYLESSHPRAILRSCCTCGGTYSRAESRLFDRFNYPRSRYEEATCKLDILRDPFVNFFAVVNATLLASAASQSSFFTNFLNRLPEYLINRALQMIFKPPCNDQRLCEVINI